MTFLKIVFFPCHFSICMEDEVLGQLVTLPLDLKHFLLYGALMEVPGNTIFFRDIMDRQ